MITFQTDFASVWRHYDQFLQLHSVIFRYMLLKRRQTNAIYLYIAARRNLLRTNQRHAVLRAPFRKLKTEWITERRTDQWWEKIIDKDVLSFV